MLAFSHVGLVVTDLERSIRFYEEALGLKCLERHPDNGRGLQIAFMGVDAPVLELLHYADPGAQQRPERGRYDHLAWYVENISQAIDRLQQHGISLEEPGVRTVLDGRQVAFFYGPDGERIELVQMPR
ncbi:MAG: hypothetical protein GX033_07005 [Firmicutes bacterium]|nr:hypothetical protein [Bacillota bacterium]